MTTPSVSPSELAGRHDLESIDLIDVRTPIEFREVRAAGARNIPLDKLDPHAVMQGRNGNAANPLFVICQSGQRGAKAQRKFAEAGYEDVANVEGGTQAWIAAGLPAIRGKKAISLERQVRIVAGLIVLVGSVAALVTGNAIFAGIPAFVGAGLLFAGVTDSCAMGMLLAKMPWNQIGEDVACCSTK